MGAFVQPEWGNFIAAAKRRFWLVPGYGVELSRLVSRRLVNSIRLRLHRGQPHLGLKRWPSWLGGKALPAADGTNRLSFPVYPDIPESSGNRTLPQLRYAEGDSERVLAAHRWGDCMVATLAGDAGASKALAATLAWIRQPPVRSDAAWEPYSSCERVVNLAVMLAARPRLFEALTPDAAHEIATFFRDSLRWINSRLEYYGDERTNNHILNNARALVVGGCVTGESAAVERGLVLFSRMARMLFQPSGFLRERSSHYQFVVSNWLLDLVHFGRAAALSGDAARRALGEIESLAVRVLSATRLLDSAGAGVAVHIGDISPDCHPLVSRLRLAALYPEALVHDAEPANGLYDEWLLAGDGTNQLLTCALPPAYPIEYTTHGHADLGGFVWFRDGQPVLVDAGRADYGGSEVARAQCGPAGHNVMMIEGLPPVADTLLAGGRWCPRPYSAATIVSEVRPATGWSIRHDGFARIAGLGEHSRAVAMTEEGVTVSDSLDGAGRVEVETFWHFAPGFIPLAAPDCGVEGHGFRIMIEENGRSPDVATYCWEEFVFSSAYGEQQCARRLRTWRRAVLPLTLETGFKVIRCAE